MKKKVIMIRKQKRNKVCRKYGEDIWGEITYKGKKNKVTRYLYGLLEKKNQRGDELLYRVDLVQLRNRRKRLSLYGELLSQRRKLLLFYGSLRRKILRKYCVEGRRKGMVSDYVVGKLESQLYCAVYRMNFAMSIFEARQRVRAGWISVNKEVINIPTYMVKEGDIIEVVPLYKERVYNEVLYRLERGWFWTSLPSYLEVNYRVMGGMVLKKAKWGDVAYPFKIEERMFLNESYGR